VTLLQQFDSLFDLTRDRVLGGYGYGTVRAFVPPADLFVTDDEVTVVMDVPGFKADELEIELIGDTLTVRGERAYPQVAGEQNRSWYRFERGYGKFQRMLQVPKGLDPDSVTASMADGVLTLHIPQLEARKPRRIEIGTVTTPTAITEHTNGDQPALAGAAA
jgi:HSP20 family protein